MKNVKFVVGIDDRVYMRWQLSILLESLHGKLPPGWEVWVVVCNGHTDLSADMRRVIETYGVRHFTGPNHAGAQTMDFAAGRDMYVPLNKIEALNVVRDHVGAGDLVCLTDTDIFLYGDLDLSVFPQRNALFDNWIVRQQLFFTYGGANETAGVRLPMLLEAMGCKKTFKPGGVTIFLDADAVRNEKVIKDSFRFAQILYLMGSMLGVKFWIAEMPAVALSLTLNGIDYDLIDAPQFTTQNHNHETIPSGTFYHYYSDLRDNGEGAFHGSKWYKHKFVFENFLMHDFAPYRRDTATDHEKAFFELAERTRQRAWRVSASATVAKRTRRERVPYFGLGFRKATLDPTLYDLLRRRLESHLDRLEDETSDVSDYVKTIVPGAPATRLQPDAEFNRALLLALRAMHEEWCGFPLVESACYGIRVYQPGAYLYEHTDRAETHIISSTICVAQQTEGPWPLCIEDIDGRRHDVIIEPGEMLFYEGGRLAHGRPYPLQGSYYAGIYLHYRPADEAAARRRA